jgi:hypothetical protein
VQVVGTVALLDLGFAALVAPAYVASIVAAVSLAFLAMFGSQVSARSRSAEQRNPYAKEALRERRKF